MSQLEQRTRCVTRPRREDAVPVVAEVEESVVIAVAAWGDAKPVTGGRVYRALSGQHVKGCGACGCHIRMVGA